jgi:hypothetical protein
MAESWSLGWESKHVLPGLGAVESIHGFAWNDVMPKSQNSYRMVVVWCDCNKY